MMKRSDISAATALLIQGYIYANQDEQGHVNALRDAIEAIEGECADWRENLINTHGEDAAA